MHWRAIGESVINARPRLPCKSNTANIVKVKSSHLHSRYSLQCVLREGERENEKEAPTADEAAN